MGIATVELASGSFPKESGCLTKPGGALLTADEHTALRTVARSLPRDLDSMVLITDEASRVVGIVSSREIRERLETGHVRERTRWGQMSIGSLMPVRIPAAFESIGFMHSDAEETPPENLPSAIIAEHDVYISWRSLARELQEAFHDHLTGLPNRAGLEHRLKQDWNRAAASGLPLTIMVIDLDYFKLVNDTYGHLFADGVLREVASALKKSLRSYDLVTRFGGDEFVALCVGCSRDEVTLPIRRMVESIQSLSFDLSEVKVTASIGAAVTDPQDAGNTPAAVFRAADACLYAAKDHRRGSAFLSEVQNDSQTPPEIVSQVEEEEPAVPE